MEAWEWSLDLAIKAMTAGMAFTGATFAGIGAWIATKKYFYEKNREVYIKRLNEVYAPLYGLIIKQNMYRELYPESDSKQGLITLVAATARRGAIHQRLYADPEKSTLPERQLLKIENMEYGLDGEDFIMVFKNANKGLMRPRLLELFNQLELIKFLVETKPTYFATSTEAQKKSDALQMEQAELKKMKIEEDLVQEIINGYYETVKKLKVD